MDEPMLNQVEIADFVQALDRLQQSTTAIAMMADVVASSICARQECGSSSAAPTKNHQWDKRPLAYVREPAHRG